MRITHATPRLTQQSGQPKQALTFQRQVLQKPVNTQKPEVLNLSALTSPVSPQFAGLFGRSSGPEAPKNRISYTSKGERKVPDHVEIPCIEGDGIGKEITRAAQKTVDEAVRLAYGDKKSIQWLPIVAGEQALADGGKDLIPEETETAIREHYVAVKGPLNTPTGKGFRSVNVQLRQLFDLFANFRPVKSLPEVVTPTVHKKIDTAIFRENTEDVYAGIEFPKGSQDALDLIAFLKEKGYHLPVDAGIGIKPISEGASKRIIEQAIRYALAHGKKSVTVMHKGNIQKYTEGAFWEYAQQVAAEKFPGQVISQEEFYQRYQGKSENLPNGVLVLKDRIADAMLQDIIQNPTQHEVIVTTNLNGDYISDAFAALVGGLGVAPGANLGDRYAIFEAVHGTAPDIAGQNKANPTSLILSMKMMLEYLNWDKAAQLLQQGVEQTLYAHQMTGDLASKIPGTEALSTDTYTEALIANMRAIQAAQPRGIAGFFQNLFKDKAA